MDENCSIVLELFVDGQLVDRYQDDPTILKNTARVLGWNEHLCRTGYNIGADGVPYPYQLITSNYAGYPDDISELYFAPVEKSS